LHGSIDEPFWSRWHAEERVAPASQAGVARLLTYAELAIG